MGKLPAGMYPAAVTPFRGEAVDREAFATNIRRWNETSLAGYLVLGSNGEGVFLEDDEAAFVVEAAAQARARGKCLVAGTGRESTRATVERTRRAARAGADAVLVSPPSYYRGAMTAEALEQYYRTVADAAGLPVLLYNVPKFCQVELSARLVLRLAEHPNILGLKDSSGDMTRLQEVLRDRPPTFQVFVGSGSLLFPGFALGCDGAMCALAGVVPEECADVQSLVAAGAFDDARKLQERLLSLNEAVTSQHGVAGLKHAMELAGYHGGDCLRPLLALDGAGRAEVASALALARGACREARDAAELTPSRRSRTRHSR